MRRGAAGARAGDQAHKHRPAFVTIQPSSQTRRGRERTFPPCLDLENPKGRWRTAAGDAEAGARCPQPTPRARGGASRAGSPRTQGAVTPRDNGPERGLLTTSGSEGPGETPACDRAGRGGAVSRCVIPVPPPHLEAGAYLQDHLSHFARSFVPQNKGSRQERDGVTTATWPPAESGPRPAAAPRGERMLSPTASHDHGTGVEASSTPSGAFRAQARDRRYREGWRATELSRDCGNSPG